MPNVIKSNTVRLNDTDVKVINSNLSEDFSPIQFRTVTEVEENTGTDQEGALSNDEEIYQMNHQMNSSDHLNEMHAFAQSIIEDARREADQIKSQALSDSEIIIEQLKQQAIEEGIQIGQEQGQRIIEQRMNELEQKEQQLSDEYDEKIEEMQGQISEILIALVHKVTGVVIEEKSIIIYLVKDAVKSQTACNEFRISVSKADYFAVSESLPELKELVRSTAVITIIENPELSANECKIETEKNIIDCGIETKIENLVMALKLLR